MVQNSCPEFCVGLSHAVGPFCSELEGLGLKTSSLGFRANCLGFRDSVLELRNLGFGALTV